MNRLYFLIAISILIISCGQNPRSESQTQTEKSENIEMLLKNSEAEFALNFINSYVENCNMLKNSIGIIEWVNSSKLVTENFKKELPKIIEEANKNDSEIGLGFDPIFDAQDYPEKGFEIESINSKSNLIILKGIEWNDFKLTLRAKFVNGKWLVDGCGIINMPKEIRSKR